ncbi:hypothetical protein EYF80_003321 [Liparis tanakae]|uniref:Uncharacterized protein n=1 Tax=Liparis tanakae TaxID=230148 RepID=A0A4Z2J9F6_9TELE|nr:hypothetical protein EYF80_003321 [Liparis tanakae]
MMNVDWEFVALKTGPTRSAWILILTEGGALMSTRQVLLGLVGKHYSIPGGEHSLAHQQDVGPGVQRARFHFNMNDLIEGSTYGYQAAAGHVFQIHRARFLQEKLSTCTWGQSRH